MDSKNFLNDIYEDFFGIEKIKKENEKLAKELNLKDDYPEIKVNINQEGLTQKGAPLDGNSKEKKDAIVTEEISKEDKDNKMAEFFSIIDDMYISEESKNIMKRIIEYIRKYSEGLEKRYIPFNLCIYSNNDETIYKITSVLEDTITYFSYTKRGEPVEVSFYNIDKPDQISSLYSEKNNIILYRDLDGFISKEKNEKDKLLHRLQEIVIDKPREFVTIFVAKLKETIDESFSGNEDIKDKIFGFEILGVNPDIQDVYQEVIDRLSENNELSDDFKLKLLDYISITFPNTNMSFPEYRDRLCQKIEFSKKEAISVDDIPSYDKEKNIDEIFAELNSLVGLDKVKQVLQDLVSLIELKNKTQNELKIKDTNLHMVFLGNPGTGKTTVARLIAGILYNLKYIKQNKLIEVSSKDLVAEYVGQTAPKTNAVIEKALGGILFIDEAYTLASGNGASGSSFNEEAIATLIQGMENYRDNLVVIFAGYTKEMQAFLNANSGIVSRIGYTLEFEDYTSEELLEIFKLSVKKAGFEITDEALDKVLELIDKHKDSKNFGNARFVRNLYEKSVIKHATNTRGKKSKKILKTIDKKDITDENLLKM